MKDLHSGHNRRSIRLTGYDYTRSGAYYVTITTQDRIRVFGDVVNGIMRLNDAGQMISDIWFGIPKHNEGVSVDEFIVMPDHIHGIIVLTAMNQSSAPNGLSLSEIVGRFKSLTTRLYSQKVQDNIWPPFNRRLWQRNYYEYIIRDDHELSTIRQYINQNPYLWSINGDSDPGH